MKLHLISALIGLTLLAGILTGCTTSKQATAPSVPLEVSAAEETIPAQPVLTTVTADSSTDCNDRHDEPTPPCVQKSGQDCSPCAICGEYNCSGGASCSGQSTHRPEDDHHGDHHNRHH